MGSFHKHQLKKIEIDLKFVSDLVKYLCKPSSYRQENFEE